MNRTTELTELKSGALFTWGDIVKIHEIGEYSIVEYHPWKTKGCEVLIGSVSEKVVFGCYIDGENMSRLTESFDSALVTCIALKLDGINSRAAEYFMKMITPSEIKEDKCK